MIHTVKGFGVGNKTEVDILGVGFLLLEGVFGSTHVFKFGEVQLMDISFVICTFGIMSEKALPNPCLCRGTLLFYSKNSVVYFLYFGLR